ncbi:hypothetical protein OAM08_00210 [Pelagibacteraceae bacterium]|nr:hypothetical protein [Pelagibacteraceae bacterium]
MKKKLFSLTIIVYLSLISFSFAEQFWSNIKDGSTNTQFYIDKLKGKKINSIEGIWFEEDLGTVAIFRDKSDQDIFKLYIVQGQGIAKKYSGTWEATYFYRGGGQYDFFSRIWYTYKDYETKTGTANLYSSSNSFSSVFKDYELGKQSFTRIWPADIVTYNAQFNKPKKEVKKKIKVPSKKKIEYKDYWWVVVLLALGTFFLYTMTVKKPKINFMKKKKSKQRGRIAKYWAGEDSLAFSFWGVSTLGLTLLQLPNIMILSQGDEVFDSMSDMTTLIYALYIIIFFIIAIIAYVGCWRSAAKYIEMKNKIKKSTFWGYTTYVAIVLSTLRVFTALVTGN